MVPKAENQTGENMNANIENMVAEYAKANKINKAKLLFFVESVLSVSGAKKESSGKRGKHVSQDTIELREALRDGMRCDWS